MTGECKEQKTKIKNVTLQEIAAVIRRIRENNIPAPNPVIERDGDHWQIRYIENENG